MYAYLFLLGLERRRGGRLGEDIPWASISGTGSCGWEGREEKGGEGAWGENSTLYEVVALGTVLQVELERVAALRVRVLHGRDGRPVDRRRLVGDVRADFGPCHNDFVVRIDGILRFGSMELVGLIDWVWASLGLVFQLVRQRREGGVEEWLVLEWMGVVVV